MKYKAVLAVAIAAAFLAVPFAFVADGSDAYTMTDGEAGIGFSLKDLSKENQKKLEGEEFATEAGGLAIGSIIDNYSNYKITGTSVSNYDLSMYQGMKIEDGVETIASSKHISFTVEFKATPIVANKYVFWDLHTKNEDIFRELGMNHVSSSEDVFTITADVEMTDMSITESSLTANSAGAFVLTEKKEQTYKSIRVTSDVNYKCTVNGNPKTIEYKTEFESSTSSDTTDKYDFGSVKIADVKGDTKCFVENTTDDLSSVSIERVTYDGSTKGSKVVSTKEIMDKTHDDSGSYVEKATVIEANFAVPSYKFYGDDGYCLFDEDDVADATLRSNDAMKKFLQDNGEIVETFDGAYSAADSEYKTASEKRDNKLIYIGIAAGAVAIIAIAAIAIIMIRKR